MPTAAAPDKSPFGRFLRATGKGHATRYGRPHERIATGAIVALPEAEAMRFRREYNRQVREGALEDVKAEDFAAWQKKRAEDGKAVAEAKAKTEAEAKKAAAEKAKREAEAEASAKGGKKGGSAS